MKKSEFQLLEQRLLYTEYKLSPSTKEETKGIKLEIKTTTHVNIEDETNREASVILVLNIFEDDMEKYPFYIQVAIEGLFSWGEEIENYNEFLRINAPAVLFSYIRSVVSNLTSYSDLPVLVLPLMDFSDNQISES